MPSKISLMLRSARRARLEARMALMQFKLSHYPLAARAIFQNNDRALLPGFFVRVRIPLVGRKARALLVPQTAIGTNQAGRYLLIVNKDHVVEERRVVIGDSEGDLRVVTSGLKPDDEVVITGLLRAVPGQKVAARLMAVPQS